MKNTDNVILSGVPLYCFEDKNKTDKPIAFGTGFIIDMPDFDYLFTAAHVINNTKGKWAILKEYIVGRGPEYVVLGQFYFHSTINIKNYSINEIDFSFTKIPFKLDYFYQEISPPGYINVSKPKIKYLLQQITTPNIDNNYGFAGHIKPKIIENYAIDTVYQLHFDYKFKETRGWTHVFEPPVKHPGNEFYHGCSGAPIIDEDNNIASLLTGGDIDKNEIYGINLGKVLIGFEELK